MSVADDKWDLVRFLGSYADFSADDLAAVLPCWRPVFRRSVNVQTGSKFRAQLPAVVQRVARLNAKC